MKFIIRFQLLILSVLMLSLTLVAEDASNPSCKNDGKNSRCGGGVGSTSPSSVISNGSFEYHGEAVDFSISGSGSGCGSCGVASPASTTALPSLSVTRRYRPRFAEFTVSHLFASFGKGHYWEEIDKSLLIQTDDRIRVLDPTSFDKRVIAEFNAARGGWADWEDESFRSITLFDINNQPVLVPSLKWQARSAVLLRQDGSTEHYELFWRRGYETVIGNARGFGRLVALMDRNGNAIQIDYERPVEANGRLGVASMSVAERDALYYQSWRKSKVTDAYGREILISNGTGQHSNNRITKLVLPNGEEISYQYGLLLSYHETLKRITFPDGSTSTWYGAQHSPDQNKIFQSDRSAAATEQKKVIYLTRNTGPDGNGGLINIVPRLIRRVDNGEGEIKYANRERLNFDGSFTTYIHEGGNRILKGAFTTIGGAQTLDSIITAGAAKDFYNANPEHWESEAIVSSQVYDNRGQLMSSQGSYGLSTSRIYDVITNGVNGKIHADGTSDAVTRNHFRQPLTSTDRLGRSTVCSYDFFGNMLSKTEGSGNPAASTKTWLYNSRGQVIEARSPLYDSSLPDLHNTQYVYNGEGFLERIISAADNHGGG